MKILVTGSRWQTIAEVFDIPDEDDDEETFVKAEEAWVAKHGSWESLDSEEVTDA